MRFRLSATAVIALLIAVLILVGQLTSQILSTQILTETVSLREMDKIRITANVLSSLIAEREDEAKAFARLLATDESIVKPLQNLTKPGTANLAQRLDEVFALKQFQTLEVAGTDETVIYRAHDPQHVGDAATGWGVAEAITGASVTTSHLSAKGLMIQAIEPIRAKGQVVGALTVGMELGRSFFAQQSDQLGAELALFGPKGFVNGTSDAAAQIADKEAVDEAFHTKVPVYRLNASTHLTSVYMPMLVVDESYVILAKLDSSDAYQLVESGRERTLLFALLTLLCSLAVGLFALRVVMKPLHQLRQRALQTAVSLTGETIIEHDHDEVRSVVKVLDTLTERLVHRNTELSLEKDRADAANRAKSQFLSTMSHEIRTPLNGVLGLTELLQSTRLDTEQQRFVKAISAAGKALHGLLSDILDLAKIEEGQIQLERIDFNPHQICTDIADVYREIASMRSLKFSFDFTALNCQWANGDPTRLRQVLANLLGNAMKFTESGGVEFKAELIPCPQDDDAIWCRFSVQDTGIGMTPEALANLFQRFNQADASTTRRFGGSGLGLSICKHLIELMGGHIHAESQPGQGSRFWFDLPLAAALLSRPLVLADLAAGSLASVAENWQVLVAEDNAINQLVIKSLLEQRGAQVTIVDNGQLALDQVQVLGFDLVFMDCQMPVMDGFEATRQIRQWERKQNVTRALPIIALTANAMASDRATCLAAGMTDFTTKPIKGEVLDQLFRTYKDQKRDHAPELAHATTTPSNAG
jgi:signal transduction histidine kinase/FixJ family two-component response regulator